ncbi:MAG: hypothetical protein AAGA18_00135 [Verrucomicrobiota bacterium]
MKSSTLTKRSLEIGSYTIIKKLSLCMRMYQREIKTFVACLSDVATDGTFNLPWQNSKVTISSYFKLKQDFRTEVERDA